MRVNYRPLTQGLAAEGEEKGHGLLHGVLDDGVDGVVEAALRLDLLAVGRQNDAAEAAQPEVLGHLADAHDVAALGLGRARRTLLVQAVLEAHDLVQEQEAHLVDLVVHDLVAVLAELAAVHLYSFYKSLFRIEYSLKDILHILISCYHSFFL